SRWTRWSRARFSPTPWRSCRASTRSWARSTADVVHAREPGEGARDHRPVSAQEIGDVAAVASRAGPGRLGHAVSDGGGCRAARSHAGARAGDVFLLHDV